MLICIITFACHDFGAVNGCLPTRQSTSSPGIPSTWSRGTSRHRQTLPAIIQSASGRPSSIHFGTSTSSVDIFQTARQNSMKFGVGVVLDVLYEKSSRRRSRIHDIIETHANASNRIISTVFLKDPLITSHPQLLRGCNRHHSFPTRLPTLDNHLHASDSTGTSGGHAFNSYAAATLYLR